MKPSELIEKWIKDWAYLEDNPSNRKHFPEDNWYPNREFVGDPLRTVVTCVGLHELRKLGRQLDEMKAEAEIPETHIHTFLGMIPETIAALKREYDIRSTTHPMTPESVKEAFSKGE